MQLVATDGVLDRNFALLGPGDTAVGARVGKGWANGVVNSAVYTCVGVMDAEGSSCALPCTSPPLGRHMQRRPACLCSPAHVPAAHRLESLARSYNQLWAASLCRQARCC